MFAPLLLITDGCACNSLFQFETKLEALQKEHAHWQTEYEKQAQELSIAIKGRSIAESSQKADQEQICRLLLEKQELTDRLSHAAAQLILREAEVRCHLFVNLCFLP